MTYLVDTDWVVEYLKGKPSVVETLRALASDGLAVSLITYGEIYEGVYYGHDRQRHEQGLHDFLAIAPTLPLTRAIMQRFAIVRGSLRRQGQLIGDADLLIAATALHHDLTLLTRNARHFQRVPDLKLQPAA